MGKSVVAIRDGKLPQAAVLEFDQQSWDEFLAGVRYGDFDLVSGTSMLSVLFDRP